MMASWICRVPVRLHTVAGLPLMESAGLESFVLETTERITYACAHVVYTNSNGLKKFIENHLSVSPEKLKIIGKGSSNGIDTNFFQRTNELENRAQQLRSKYNICADDIVFSFVGRIVRDKGIVELVNAFRKLTQEKISKNSTSGRRLFLLLLGQFEDDLDPLPDAIREFLTNDTQVVLAGFQHDIRPWIIASDVFVFPSYREGFPNVVMQASLLRVPCIVSDINGCNEIVTDGSSGVVVPVKNVLLLADAMKRMMNDVSKRKCFAEAAYAFVATNFKREIIWEELKNEYQKNLRSRQI